MQHLRKILGEFVKDFGIESGSALNSIRKQWAVIVGQTIAAHTYPDTIRGGILTIVVDTPQWMHHLSFYRDEILEKLKSHSVSGIRFRLGRIPEKTDSRQVIENLELSDEDMRYLESTLENIKDEDLKERFRTLISHGLKKGKK